MLQLREKEIFETLKKMIKFKFVIIGGYAVNAYTLPRFSVDCDIVVKNKDELREIKEALDRQTNATFSADWVFDNSEVRTLRGKTITEELKLRIINLDALFILKLV